MNPWGSLASQPNLVGSLGPSERPYVKGKGSEEYYPRQKTFCCHHTCICTLMRLHPHIRSYETYTLKGAKEHTAIPQLPLYHLAPYLGNGDYFQFLMGPVSVRIWYNFNTQVLKLYQILTDTGPIRNQKQSPFPKQGARWYSGNCGIAVCSFAPLSVYVSQLRMWGCKRISVHMHVWWQQKVFYLGQYSSEPLPLTQGLSLGPRDPTKLGWLASEPHGFIYHCVPCTRKPNHFQLSAWVPGIELRSSGLHGKHFMELHTRPLLAL